MNGTDMDKRASWEKRVERLRHWHHACVETSETVNTYNLGDTSNPLFFFHGDWEGGGHYVRRIASLSGHAIIAFGPHGMHGDPVPGTVEDMAAERLGRVLHIRPQGPYRLGGYCNGALLAYELARMLIAAGHKVDVTILIEPPSLNATPLVRSTCNGLKAAIRATGRSEEWQRKWLQRLMNIVWQCSRVSSLSTSEAWAMVQDRLPRSRPRSVAPDDAQEVRQFLERNRSLLALYDSVSDIYVPQPIDAPVVVMSNGRDQIGRRRASYDGRSWRHVCSDFTYIDLSGTHVSWKSDHIATTVAHLDRILSPLEHSRRASLEAN